MDALQLVAIAVAGLVAGTVNTIAGGGSLIGIAALIFAGLPANAANATNRIGVFVQSGIATWQFHREGVLEPRRALVLLLPTCLGALAGSLLSVDIDEQLFRQVIGVVMLAMLPVILLRPRRWLTDRSDREGDEDRGRATWLQLLGFCVLGFYGGFLQAGVGIFLLAALVLLAGEGLVRANAIKVLLVAVFTLPPLAVYLYSDLIVWVPGLLLALGSAIGGWLGTKLTVSWGPRFVRWVLLTVIAVSASRLLGLW